MGCHALTFGILTSGVVTAYHNGAVPLTPLITQTVFAALTPGVAVVFEITIPAALRVGTVNTPLSG